MLARSVSAWYLFACLELGDLATVRVAAGMTVIYFKLLLELGYRGQGGGGDFRPRKGSHVYFVVLVVEAGQLRRAGAPRHGAEELRPPPAVRRRHRGGRISRLM